MKRLLHLLCTALCIASASAQKISELPSLTPSGTSSVVIVEGGTTGRASVAAIVSTGSLTYQPLDSDLTAIAALTTTTFGRSLLTQADAAAVRTVLGLGGAATLEVGTTAGTVMAGDDSRLWVKLPDPFLWSDISGGGTFVWTGLDNSTIYVDSSSTGTIIIHNAAVATLWFSDPNEGNSLQIPPGATVWFEATDLGGGDVDLSDEMRSELQPRNDYLDDLADGMLSGSLMQPAGASNSGALTNTTQTIAGDKTNTGRLSLTGQPSLPASTDAMTRDGVEANRWIASPLYRDLFIADRTTSGTGVTGTGTFAVEGRSGGFFSAGDATSAIYCAGISTVTGYATGGNNMAWSYPWWIYTQFEASITTNCVMRIVIGLRTDTTSDISTVSGSYAGVEWSSSTSVRGFGASGSTPTVGSGTTSSTIANVRNHLWFRNNANGTVSVYHATGFAPRLPSSALLTISGAPTGNGGTGFQLLLKGTGTSANGTIQALNARLIIP